MLMLRKTVRSLRHLLVLSVLAAVLLFAGAAMASEDDPENDLPPPREADASYGDPDVTPWHERTLSPGETYDVGTSQKNTTVYISQPGSYYLKGQSSHCRIVVKSGGVDLYLKDKLNIDPNAYAYVGSSTAAITIEDMGGTVRIISEKDADIYLGGYYYCPAIRKDKHNTKLIFETEDPEHPGTITAYRSITSHSAGIGSVYHLVTSTDVPGNMEFKSGVIIATGGGNAAGIGGGSGTTAEHLLFSGATVTAYGNGAGAGIGSGMNTRTDSISITGGSVTASSENGAGIGSGEANSTLDPAALSGSITITGGTVNATSIRGSGIGAGLKGSIEHIVISGGTITAVSKSGVNGAGIGASGLNTGSLARCHLLEISGGTVYAEAGGECGVGIGSSLVGEKGDTVINISGGYIVAKGGKKGAAIGGGGNGTVAYRNKGHCYVNISGGTVQCGSIHSSYDLSCTITGGSLYCDKKNIDCTPVNGSKEEVLQTEVILFQLGDRVPVTAAEITTGTGAYDYGLHDVVTINGGKVYPWLPYGTAVEKATASGTDYYGKAFSSHSGTLYPPTEIVLDSLAPGKPGAQNGSARGPYGWSKATDLVNAVRPGYILKGYAADRNSNQLVMDTDGTFYENIAGYTGQGGEWKLMGGSITLYALWESDPFTVHFESNVPAGASTVPSGEMADEDFIYPDPKALTRNAFTLPGYRFTGWNTKADGSGTAFADGDDGSPLWPGRGETVTLYAQWKPITYTVRFLGNGATGSMPDRTFTFDTKESLPLNTFVMNGSVFAGWERDIGTLGTRFGDGQTVTNLAREQDAVVELTALWLKSADIMFSVTLDGVPQQGCAITLMHNGTSFSPVFTETEKGVYIADGTGLPPDRYEVFLNGIDTGYEIVFPSADITFFFYFTLSAKKGMNIGTVTVKEGDSKGPLQTTPAGGNKIPFNGTDGYPAGSLFTLTASDIANGYVFSRWSSESEEPEWYNGGKSTDNPVVVSIRGKTVLNAEASPVRYTVIFNANAPLNASTSVKGSMKDQPFVYGRKQFLSKNAYTLQGYVFTGWNTKADSSGTAFADEEDGSSLRPVSGDTVTLYAQWRPVTYTLVFDGNSGQGTMQPQRLTFDRAEKLSPNLFYRPEHYFLGWSLSPEDSTPCYTDGQEVLNLAFKQDARITLFAVWGKLEVSGPDDASVLEGEQAVFTVTAKGSGALSYQWQIDRGSGWEDLKGATEKSYTTSPAKLENDGYLYRCVVTDSRVSVKSRTAKLTVRPIPPTGDESRPFLLLLLALSSSALALAIGKRSGSV